MKQGGKIWLLIALLTIIPLAAIFHHAIFFRPTCMLNPFGPEYSPEVIATWLRNDPSISLAIIGALMLYALGLYLPILRLWVLAFVIAFLPLSVWIWDIPFTGRAICHLFHDGRTPIRTRHLYITGAVMYFPIVLWLRRSLLPSNKRLKRTGG